MNNPTDQFRPVTLIDRIKEADAQDDLPGVMSCLGDLLETDFARSVKSAMEGAKSFLKGGVFSSRYESTFWTSDLPMRFGERFASHPLYAHKFWRNLFERSQYEVPLLTRLAAVCPDALEDGVRRHRIFFEDAWPLVSSVFNDNGLSAFADDCETIRTLKQDTESHLKTFDPLLRKISAETLVVHFGVWLEKKYFEEPDDRWFSFKLNEHIEVLQGGLKRIRDIQKRPTGRDKQTGEIEKIIKDVFSRLRKQPETPLDSERLFEALEDWLSVGHVIEMFSAHGWTLHRSPGVHVSAKNEAQAEAWELNKEKFHAMDSFETWAPLSERENDLLEKCMSQAPNPASGNTDWCIYTAQRFLARHCGVKVTELAEQRMGFSVNEALRVLLANKACYDIAFVEPSAIAKANGGDYLHSLGLRASRRELEATRRGEMTMLRCIPIEPRSFNVIVDRAREFPTTTDIPAERIRKIYDCFAQNIHVEKIELKDKLILQNQHCDLFLRRIFSADVKTALYNHLFEWFPKEIASLLESLVNDIFECRGFKTLLNEKLGKDGEIDVLAYRDSTIFVIETKATRIRATSSEIWPVRESLSKGAGQLERIVSILSDHWGRLHERLGAPRDLGDVRIIPMLVSNSLEFDHLYFGESLKISSFELEMAFADNWPAACSLRASHVLRFSPEQINPAELGAYMESLTVEDMERYRLYGPEAPSVDELIACIEESRFWAKVFGRKMALTPLAKK